MKIPKVSVRQDGNTGAFYIEYRYDGRRRRPRVGMNKGEAERIAYDIRQHLIQGKDPKLEMSRNNSRERARNLKLKEFWHPFSREHLPTLRPKSQELYQYLMNTISGYPIARLPICEINRRAVIQYQQQRQGKASPATINREVQLIKSMLGRAYEWEILDRDLRPGMRLLKEHNRRDVSNIKPEQILALFESLPSGIADISEAALYTGFRKEAILSMKIGQVQLPDIGNAGTVQLEAKGGGIVLKEIGSHAVRVLRKAIGDRTEGYVFLSSRGRRYSSIHTTFNSHVRKLKITIADGRKFCFHDFRRLCATWLLNAGRSLDEVREALDHKDRKTTDRYARRLVSGEIFDSLPVLERKEKVQSSP